MSTVKSKKYQVGTDATASNNFTIYQPGTPDGTVRIGQGNADSPTEILKLDSDGLAVNTTGYLKIPTGTTAQRPGSATVGMLRYNTTKTGIETWNGSVWNEIQSVPFTKTISYLVIAGGGGGAAGTGGGGGAGGYRNSFASETSGGNSATETPIGVPEGTSTVLTVTVGAGGAGNAIGVNSSITGTNISIVSTYGGGGSSVAGGSGSGAANNGTGGSGTVGQGFKGGNQSGWAGVYGSGGGGGAGQEGVIGTSAAPGNGGNGLSSSITGSAVTRAGGGGGGTFGSALYGLGGAGGGGDGAGATNYNPGATNTGSGGGGSSDNANTQGAGGSGVVILRVATLYYTGTTTGSPTVTTDGTDTVMVFNSSGTYTA
jgi:hypothetical protein